MSLLNPSDVDLLQQMASGNERAFEQLYHRYSGKMLRYVYNKVHSKAAAEEIIHDCFLRIWNHRKTLSINTSFEGYFFITVRNQVLQYLRSLDDIELFVNEIYAANIADNTPAPTAREYQSLEIALENCVRQLPEKCRIIYQLSRDHSLSIREIAGKLDISQQTVKNQVSKALRILKSSLQEIQSFLF